MMRLLFLIAFLSITQLSFSQSNDTGLNDPLEFSCDLPAISSCEGPINVPGETADFFSGKRKYDGRLYYKVIIHQSGTTPFLTWENNTTGEQKSQKLRLIEGYEAVCSSFEFTENKILKVYYNPIPGDTVRTPFILDYVWKGDQAGNGQFEVVQY